MKVVELTQGSPEWLAHRAQHFNASDAPAMMGCSPYKTRTQLLDELSRGFAAEVDAGTQRLFDAGHRFEALARPVAEGLLGEDLYPVVGTEGRYSASFDGLTLAGDTVFEHKTLNAELRDLMPAVGDALDGRHLPLHYRVQMEQQFLVSGAERALFMATKWDGDTLIEQRHCWYHPDDELRAQILAGWEQFERDLAAHVPTTAEAKPIGATPESLPALRIEVTGMVTASNLDVFKTHALQVVDNINRDLQTDQDFADAEATVKWCKGVEDKLAAAKANALAQTESIDALFRTMDDVGAEFKRVRLELDKLVSARKDAIRTEIVMDARAALCQHVADLTATLPKNCAVPVPAADFPGVIKGKRSVDSIRDAVSTLLASAKAEATQTALRMRANLDAFNLLAADRATLFPDLGQLALKPAEDFSALVQGRLAQHDAEQKAAQERAAAAAQAALQAAAVPPPPPAVAPAPAVATQAAKPATPTDEPATLPLGKICERLGLTVTSEQLEKLGYPAHRERAARLYRESDFPGICEAISAHVLLQASRHRRELAAA